jgi:hypothetical protein
VTNNEKNLVGALEADIQRWESEAKYFESLVSEIEMNGEKVSGKAHAAVLRRWIAEYRALIEKVKKG